jgi:hypothetical protein
VEAKVVDFDIKGAVKLLSSDDSLASFNEDVAEELKENILHHLANFFPNAFKPGDFSLIVNERSRSAGIKSFFCSTLSEFENFLLCERILINVTTCQNETSS